MRRHLQRVMVAAVLSHGCDRAPEPTPSEPAASPPPTPAAPAGPAPQAEPPRAVDDPTLWIEAVTDTLWRLEDPVLTEAVLEVVSGATPCVPLDGGGCRLGPIAPASVLARLGLREGDALQTVAGLPIGTTTQWREALRSARAQGLFALTLVRDGAERTQHYRFRTMRPQSPRRDRIERGFDVLARGVQVQGADAIEVDRGALELAVDAVRRGLAPECGAWLARRPGWRLVAVDDADAGAGSLSTALSDALERGGPFDVRLEAKTEEAPITLRVTPREGLLGPSELTIASTSLSVDPSPDADSSSSLAPAPATGPVTELEASISKSDRARLLTDPVALAGTVRIVPSRDGGFKLFSIRRESVLDVLGFRNGDRITALDGDPITPELMMEQYRKLSKADSVRVDFDRRGERFALTIRIAP
ncbi:MAG: hypothetical protein K1X88_17350 [Nannocystaceae bacterium]|nr:hypothetical protein [Nannocystaceae bacterium]